MVQDRDSDKSENAHREDRMREAELRIHDLIDGAAEKLLTKDVVAGDSAFQRQTG